MADLTARKLSAEAIGTGFLLATVTGAGIMAERLSEGNIFFVLLANSLAVGAILTVMISLLGPVSGGHFNPAVTLAFALRREIDVLSAAGYICVQIGGGILGVLVAHLMFDEAVIQLSRTVRDGPALWFSELVATFGLIMVILGALRVKPGAVAWMVGLYIFAAYWFTSSTSFANPAVTLARTLTDTITGIRADHASMFILAQFVGAVAAVGVCAWLFQPRHLDER